MKKILVKHVGNMGDMVFIVPPVLEVLKRQHPDSHITFVTAWGFKEVKRRPPFFVKRAYWGHRNQSGFCIALIMTNPHIDQVVHYHDTALSLDGKLCQEEGVSFPTWNKKYYEEQKASGDYDAVYELDFGIDHDSNPLEQAYRDVLHMPEEHFSNYRLYFTDQDKEVAAAVTNGRPKPQVVLLEGLEGTTTRGWDPAKVSLLEKEIEKKYGVKPFWFGGKHIPEYQGRKLSLRENIATLLHADVAIGVLSGPMHFAAAVGCPTICLYADHPIQRAAPAYFLNEYIADPHRKHRTLLGVTKYSDIRLLKDDAPFINLTPAEAKTQGYKGWQNPGRQHTKSILSVITVDEVMTVINDHFHGTS